MFLRGFVGVRDVFVGFQRNFSKSMLVFFVFRRLSYPLNSEVLSYKGLTKAQWKEDSLRSFSGAGRRIIKRNYIQSKWYLFVP